MAPRSRAFAISAPSAAEGFIEDDGGVTLTAYFMFPPTSADITSITSDIAIANEVIWDATDGQVFLKKIVLTDDPRDRRTAQILLISGTGRAGSGKLRVTRDDANGRYVFGNDGGQRVMTFKNFNATTTDRGNTLGHELGHLVLGLSDEYPSSATCGGRGPCIDVEDDFNNCIMESYENGIRELCTDANHDLLQGDGPTGDRCNSTDQCELQNCEGFNSSTQDFETTNRRNGGVSCWEIVATRFSAFMHVPAGDVDPGPTIAPPSTTIVNDVVAPSFVVVLGDVSGSMSQAAVGSTDPVCVDTNADGVFDNQPCSQSRLTLMDDALDLFATAARDDGFQVAVKTFNGSTTDRVSMQALSAASLSTFTSALNGVTSSGLTGIGTALNSADAALDVVSPTGPGRSILLITDGENTTGPDPVPLATALLDSGTSIFTIVTGADGGVGSVPVLDAERPRLSQAVAQNAAYLRMQTLQHWVQLSGRVALTPPLRYNIEGKLKTTRSLPTADWPSFWRTWSPNTKSTQTSVVVPSGTTYLEAAVAEHQDATRGFELTFTFIAPNGSSYTSTPSSTTAGLSAVRRNGYLFARIAAPAAGTWTMRVTAPTSGIFRGQMQAYAKTPNVFSEVWTRETSTPNVFTVQFNAHIKTPLNQLADVKVTALSRFGEVLTLNATPLADSPSTYEAVLDVRGRSTSLWDVLASGRVVATTFNDPGEPIFSQPANSVTLPSLHFTEATSIQGIK